MSVKRNVYLLESLKRLENNTFDERDIKLLLIEIRDLLMGESFLREVADFVAQPDRAKGMCHITINSRYGKMKFADEGQKRLHDDGVFANNTDKPWSFFSDQMLSYIQTPQIKKEIFKIIIKEGIEEIPEHLFLKYYKINKHKVRTVIFSAYNKANGYYQIKPEIKGRDYLFLDDLLKFIRGTTTGISAFNDVDLKKDLMSGISRIVLEQKLGVDLGNITNFFDSVIVCIIPILHEATFKMFDGTTATSYLTVSVADPLKEDKTQYLSLNVQTPNFSFPIISTNIIATTYIEASNESLVVYEGMRIPWNYASRNEGMKLVLIKNSTYDDETK